MRQSVRSRACALLVALGLASAWHAAPAQSGEIFKCVAKDGTPLYQNFPCNIDSLGFLPSNAQGPQRQTPSPATGGPAKPNVQPLAASVPGHAPVNTAATANRIDLGTPHVGMTTEEVKVLWGEPDDVTEDEPGDGPRVSNWRYSDGRTVQFDHKHRVLGVQR
jgi:hypothetical protein